MVSSHWESRVLRGSIMTAVLGNPTSVRIDPITLAALQDTGWYTVNLSGAQTLVWGKGKEKQIFRRRTHISTNKMINIHL